MRILLHIKFSPSEYYRWWEPHLPHPYWLQLLTVQFLAPVILWLQEGRAFTGGAGQSTSTWRIHPFVDYISSHKYLLAEYIQCTVPHYSHAAGKKVMFNNYRMPDLRLLLQQKARKLTPGISPGIQPRLPPSPLPPPPSPQQPPWPRTNLRTVREYTRFLFLFSYVMLFSYFLMLLFCLLFLFSLCSCLFYDVILLFINLVQLTFVFLCYLVLRDLQFQICHRHRLVHSPRGAVISLYMRMSNTVDPICPSGEGLSSVRSNRHGPHVHSRAWDSI